MRLGIIARSDKTGLGNQTHELVKMLSPDKILLINSFYFNRNKQFPQTYNGYNVKETSRGFANEQEVREFLKDLDAVLSCETFYNRNFVKIAKELGVKTFLQYNFEFLDNLRNEDWPLPDVLIAPSLWNFDFVLKKFKDKCDVVHLPPPTSPEKFKLARESNLTDHNRILHVAGKIADSDRNGTNTIMQMLAYSKADYELVITVQNPDRLKKISGDSRLKIDDSNPNNSEDLYINFDAMVLPRRYAGLCLPMNESLISGLPVFMTDISPNNTVLPREWLVRSKQISRIKTRTTLPVYEGDPAALAKMVDLFVKKDKQEVKQKAFEIGCTNFSPDSLKDKYIELLQK